MRYTNCGGIFAPLCVCVCVCVCTYLVMRMIPVAHIWSFGFSTAAISRRLKVEG